MGAVGGGTVPGMAGASLESTAPTVGQAEPGELLEDWMRLTEMVARLVPVSWLGDMADYLAERIAARRG